MPHKVAIKIIMMAIAQTNRADIHPTIGAPSRLVQSVAITLKTCCMGVTIQMDRITALTRPLRVSL